MQQTASFNQLSASIKGLIISIGQMAEDITAIAKLETKLAGMSLLYITVLLFFGSILCFSIWFTVLLAVGMWLLHLGYTWPLVLLSITVVNLVLLLWIGWVIKRSAKHLRFTATRRQLHANPLNLQGTHYAKPSEETNSSV